nr:MAG TPA: hypothetical protein [Caudoviricetes sp.]
MNTINQHSHNAQRIKFFHCIIKALLFCFALFITNVLGIKAFIRYNSNVDTTLSTPVLVPRTF